MSGLSLVLKLKERTLNKLLSHVQRRQKLFGGVSKKSGIEIRVVQVALSQRLWSKAKMWKSWGGSHKASQGWSEALEGSRHNGGGGEEVGPCCCLITSSWRDWVQLVQSGFYKVAKNLRKVPRTQKLFWWPRFRKYKKTYLSEFFIDVSLMKFCTYWNKV